MSAGIVRPDDPLWLEASVDVRRGFEPELVERLVRTKEREPWASPWLHAPTELYSFGRCYREWTGWPRWLPIPVYGDHGVVFGRELEQHERETTARVHLTWSTPLADANRGLPRPRVVLAQNPWVAFRRARGIEPRADRAGTLVVPGHSVPGVGRRVVDRRAAAELRAELAATGPVVAMLHRFDVENGLHRDLAAAGIPVVTAGNTTSPRFVERFYAILSAFAHLWTESAGSHVLYAAELGLPVTIEPLRVFSGVADEDGGPKAAAIRRLAQDRPPDPAAVATEQRVIDAFGPDGSAAERQELVRDLLGVDRGIGPAALRRLFARELVATARTAMWPQRRRFVARLLELPRRVLGRVRSRGGAPTTWT